MGSLHPCFLLSSSYGSTAFILLCALIKIKIPMIGQRGQHGKEREEKDAEEEQEKQEEDEEVKESRRAYPI